MITVRRAGERRHDLRRRHEVWRTFDPQERGDPLGEGFGLLEVVDEDRLPPGAGVALRPHHAGEIITYVREGALAFKDSVGRSGTIRAGEFQCITAGRGLRHRETNASATDWAHVIQLGLRASAAGLEPSHAAKRFSVADRRGGLCLIASSDERRGSLRLHADARLYAALLDPGQHIVHELAPRRSAWLQLVQGEILLGELTLKSGDGAGITRDRAVSFTAREETELLLVDLGP